MKTLRIFLACVAWCGSTLHTFGQTTPTCGGTNSPLPSWYTPNWDWLDPTPSNWYAQILTGTITMGSPFTANTNTNDMLKVISGLDYQREQGWVLLAKDFGAVGDYNAANATPYFIMYNKYRGLVRLFMYYGNTNSSSRASVILKWSPNNGLLANNSLLTLANSFALANENYPVSNNSEKHINYLNQVSNSGAWGVTEYLVNFDPNTVKNLNNFQYINFDFKLSNTSTVSLGGDFSFSTESATAKNPPAATTNGTNANWLDYVVNGKSALSKAPKASEIKSGFDNIADGVNTIDEKFCNNFTRDLHNMNNSLQTGQLKQFLIGSAQLTEGVGGLLGVAGSVLDLFMSKSNSAVSTNTESFIQPTLSKGTLTLSGTIVSESNPLSITLQLPGTSHKYSNGTVNCPNLPVYDCPLGVISLQEAPTLQVRTITALSRAGYFRCTVDYSRNSSVGSSSPLPLGAVEYSLGACGSGQYLYRRETICTASFPTKALKSYKVTGNVKLALNAQAGVVVESTKAALYFQIKKIANRPAFDLLQTTLTPTLCYNPLNLLANCSDINNPAVCEPTNVAAFNPVASFTETGAFTNYARAALNAGDLRLSSFDNVDSLHSFQTPFIDISKFKNTAITIEDGCDVYLKVLITLRPSDPADDQTPVVYLATYQLPANKLIADNSSVSPFILTCDQKLEEDTVLIGPGGTTFSMTSVGITGYAIKTASNSIITAMPNGTTNLEAFSSIKLKPDFRTQVQPGGLFTAHLNPNLSGCATATNALVLQTYTFDCSGNASANRPAHYTSQNNVAGAQLTLAEQLQNIQLIIAPNPSSGAFKLIFNKKVDAGRVTLYNSMGQEVRHLDLTNDSDAYELDLAQYLSRGVYYLCWNNASFVIQQKLVINSWENR